MCHEKVSEIVGSAGKLLVTSFHSLTSSESFASKVIPGHLGDVICAARLRGGIIEGQVDSVPSIVHLAVKNLVGSRHKDTPRKS